MNKSLQKSLAITLLGLAMVYGSTLSAQESCYPTEIIEVIQGTQTNGQPVPADRSNPEVALGEPDASNAAGGFFSLGVGGTITLGFTGQVVDAPGVDLLIYETSFSGEVCGASDDEFADIELYDGSAFVAAGTICRDGEIDFADYGVASITALRITSAAQTATPDGWDLDGVVAVNGCSPVTVEDFCYTTEVVSYEPGPKSNGQPITDLNRLDPTQALGEPQLDDSFNFVSLGYGGQVTVGFSGEGAVNGPGNDILVAETTFNNNPYSNYPERANVYVSQDGVNFYFVGETFTNDTAGFDIDAAGQGFEYVSYVRVVDTTPEGSVSEDGYDVDAIYAINGCIEIPEDDEPCEGVWRTQTQGGWGTGANGNNPGVYRDANFASAFPNGLVIGCEDGFTLTLTSSEAVEDFLPSGGQPAVFEANLVDPTGNEGSFTGNLTALALSLGFDAADPDFAPGSDYALADLIIQEGQFTGFTVGEVFALANEVIGGCNDDYSPSQMNSIVDAINNSYVDGEDDNNGLLGCDELPGGGGVQQLPAVLQAYPNPSPGQVVITVSTQHEAKSTLVVRDLNGRVVAEFTRQQIFMAGKYRFDLDATDLPNGIYVAQLTTENEVITERILIAR